MCISKCLSFVLVFLRQKVNKNISLSANNKLVTFCIALLFFGNKIRCLMSSIFCCLERYKHIGIANMNFPFLILLIQFHYSSRHSWECLISSNLKLIINKQHLTFRRIRVHSELLINGHVKTNILLLYSIHMEVKGPDVRIRKDWIATCNL